MCSYKNIEHTKFNKIKFNKETKKSPLWKNPQRAVIQLLMLIFQLSTGSLHAHDGVGVKHTATNLLKHRETD